MKNHITVSELKFLERESRLWEEEGIVSEPTRSRIIERYARRADSERLQFVGVWTALALAVILLGFAAFLLVSFNWAHLTATMKLAILFGSMALAYGTGAFFAKSHPIVSESAFFAGTILFGVGIWQIAQIFHVTTDFPDGLWFWAVGSFFLAQGLRTPIVHLFTCFLLIFWLLWTLTSHSFVFPLGFRTDFLTRFCVEWKIPSLCLSLPILTTIGWRYAGAWSRSRICAEVVRFAYALTAIAYLLLLPVSWNLPQGISFYYLLLGTVFILFPPLFAAWRESETGLETDAVSGRLDVSVVGRLFSAVGMVTLASALIPFSCYAVWLNGGDWKSVAPISAFVLSCFPGVAFLIFLLFSLRKSAVRAFVGRFKFFLALVFYGLLALTLHRLFALENRFLFNFDVEFACVMTFLQNVFMFALGLVFICRGLRDAKLFMFIFGVIYFLFWAFLRYLDLFGGFGGMLGASGLFAFCALILFGFSWYWSLIFKSSAKARSVDALDALMSQSVQNVSGVQDSPNLQNVQSTQEVRNVQDFSNVQGIQNAPRDSAEAWKKTVGEKR